MKILSEEKMIENLQKLYSYIGTHIKTEGRADALLSMYKEIEEELMLAPASTHKDRHNAFPGGYLDHVNNVVENAILFDKVWDRLGQSKNYTLEELVFSAINHDLGKLGYGGKPHYVPNDSDWHYKKGYYFTYNTELTHMRISDRSLFILQRFGIPVTENEFLAIKLHDGLYEDSNKAYYISSTDFSIKSNIVHILHQADFTASIIETQKNK